MVGWRTTESPLPHRAPQPRPGPPKTEEQEPSSPLLEEMHFTQSRRVAGGREGGCCLLYGLPNWSHHTWSVCLSVCLFSPSPPLRSPSRFVKSWLVYRGSLVLYGGPLLLSTGWRFCPSCALSLFSPRHKGPRFSGLALSLILFLSLSSLLKCPLSPFLFHFSFTTIWSSLLLSSATNL